MPYGTYQNKIRRRKCPVCGERRPLDWYGKKKHEEWACWKCRQLKLDGDKPQEVASDVLIG